MLNGLRFEITSPYTKLESLLYDRVVAPAVTQLRDAVLGELLADLPSQASILDVGCGGGQIATLLLEERADLHVTGLDLSPEQIGRAIARTADFADRTDFVVGAAEAMPFCSRSFDLVLSVASLKHWPDKKRGLGECLRVLKPGGRLAIIEADRDCRDSDARAFIARWQVPRAMKAFALLAFRNLVAAKSLARHEIRELIDGLPIADHDVRLLPSTPAWILIGRRSPAPSAIAATGYAENA
jgi:ubiquinone/menaquinone biosynthesis C-methylase UbiE